MRSILGEAVVAAENASLRRKTMLRKSEASDAILNGLRGINSPRVELLSRPFGEKNGGQRCGGKAPLRDSRSGRSDS